MGGSSGGGGGKAPQQAAPIDYAQLMAAASAAATEQVKQQYKSLIENYPALETLSLGTVDAISGRLGDKPQPIYELREKKTKGAGIFGRENTTYERVQVGSSEPNNQSVDALNYIRQGLAIGKMDPAAADPTSIEKALYAQGERELALGRSLSPEQIRESQQAARASMSARGLGSSMATTAAEILNRDSYASARERERQGFASAANDQFVNNITQRRMNLANTYFAGAGNLIAADPYSRALGPGLQYSGGTQGNQMQQIGGAFNSANQMAGNVASFNANMLDSRYNAWANQQGARMAGNAARQAGTMGMIGSIAGGVLGGAGMALSDRREKTEIKPLGKSGSILGLKTYSYKYKGDDKKRIGVMAQDVQKVLPEAVEEVTYKGKKRLAIKPAVIGAALAEELAAQAA